MTKVGSEVLSALQSKSPMSANAVERTANNEKKKGKTAVKKTMIMKKIQI